MSSLRPSFPPSLLSTRKNPPPSQHFLLLSRPLNYSMATKTMLPTDFAGISPIVITPAANDRVLPEPDVFIHTSGGTRIPAHTNILVLFLFFPLIPNMFSQLMVSKLIIWMCFFGSEFFKASISPVLENIIDQPRKHRGSERIIQIHGVPCEAVAAFVGFLYFSRSVSNVRQSHHIFRRLRPFQIIHFDF